MEPVDNFRHPEDEPDHERGATVYVRCPSCGHAVRLPPPESGEPPVCDGCGARVSPVTGT
jgi:uncharacterized paraquat-inducible protein A